MHEEKNGRAFSQKPEYGLRQNSAYMIALAWRNQRSVLWLCLASALLAVAESLAGLLAAPMILGQLQAGAPLPRLLLAILAFTAALLLTGAARAYVSANTIFGRIALRMRLASALHAKFQTTSFPNTEDPVVQKKLEAARDAVSGNDRAAEAVWSTLTGLLQNALGFVLYLLLLSSLNGFLVAVTLVTAVAGALIHRRTNGWLYRRRERKAELERRMTYLDDRARDAAAAKDIRVFEMRGWLTGLYRGAVGAYHAFVMRGAKEGFSGDAADAALAFLRGGVAYAYLIGLVLRGGLSAAQFLLYFTAVGGFTAWVTGILNDLTELHRHSLALSTVREFLELPEPFRFEDGEPLEPVPGGAYEIALRHVSFRYPGAKTDTLHDVGLTVRPGEKLALVGLNGAGKTTLIRLLCGLYDPTEGEVLLNGRNIRSLNRRDYYRLFSAVFQQFSFLAATVAENIAQTDGRADPEKVRACAERAGIGERIGRFPQGYETHLGREVYEDGVELSGGEKQRLMLARALYKDAPIVVLDEPTSALDPIAESAIYARYGELTAGRTSVFISHRLASTRFCDRILLLEAGRIAEEGTHDELLRLGGRYARLFELQSRYYREGGLPDEKGQTV